MRIEQLNPRERRIIALGVLLAVSLLVVFAVVGPYLARYPYYLDSIAESQHQLERLERVAAQLPRLRGEVAALREHYAAMGHTLEANTAALAAAEMQQLVAEVVSRHGGELQSTRVGRVLEEEGFRRVTVSARMSVTSEVLADVLGDLEYRAPLMFVDNLQVRLENRRVRRGMPVDETGMVSVEFDLFAYMTTDLR